MRFEVPQFIEIEDKIFGPFTWRQFLYLGGGVGWAVISLIYFPFIIFVLTGLPAALLAGALSFYPINNRPFSYFIEAIFNYLTSQRLYLWRRGADVVYKGGERSDTIPTTPVQPVVKHKQTDLTSLARKLELQAIQKSE
ncbi:PrgI family protein [Candidatus Kaiserbacteria bacterium]|nr:PrgI family protein [Candidatus Kaiserbacteria bacterium]